MGSRIVALIVGAGLGLAACGSRSDPFPPGLAPLEDDTAPMQTAPYHETLAMVHGAAADYYWVHGRGYLLAPPGQVWAKVKDADLEAVSCSTTSHTVAIQTIPAYELSFQVHYIVMSTLTIDWTEQWRFGTIEGTPDAPDLALGRYQKIEGSAFISVLEGSIEVLPTDDPNVTELQLIEHVGAIGTTVDDSLASMQHRFDSLAAVVHGGVAPACP